MQRKISWDGRKDGQTDRKMERRTEVKQYTPLIIDTENVKETKYREW